MAGLGWGRLWRTLAGGTEGDPADHPGPPGGGVSRSWTSADGLRLHAYDYAAAEGPARLPVICLHGLTRNGRDFEALAPWIAGQGRRVLALDTRGRGRSEWDPRPMNYTPAMYASDVLALMDAAGVARAQFVGTSMGGIVTMVLASMRPHAVAGAVLNDVGPRLNAEGLKRIGTYTGQPAPARDWTEAAAVARRINGAAFPDYGNTEWEAFARRLFELAPEGGLRLAYDPDIAAPIRAAGPNALAPDITPLFVALATGRPLLLIRGALSDLLDDIGVAHMRQLAPHIQYAEVPRVGHAPMLSEPDARAAIAAYLAENP